MGSLPPERGLGEGDDASSADRIFKAGFFVSLVFIAFVAGAIVTTAGVTPGKQIGDAYLGGKALYDRATTTQNLYLTDLWYPERRPDKGVTVNDAMRTEQGLTLYTSGEGAVARLIAMDGSVVHEWRRPYSSVWHEGAAVKRPQPDAFVYFRKAIAYPNGDLLVVYEGAGDTPYGYGVAKLDKDSNVIWSYLANAHHDIDVGPDGRIYVITHEFVDKKLDGFDNFKQPRLDDFLVILSPDGQELKKIALIQAVARSEFRQMLYTVSAFAVSDPLHTNNVDYITAEEAANFPYAKEGQVLVSFRELGAVAVLDPDAETITWAKRSDWLGQHDPDILPNGDLILFDNFGNYDRANARSRVIEVNPRTSEIVWEYGGTPEAPLDSMIRSAQQRLKNGNTLITESSGGRLLEVTREGDIVWEYINPVRAETLAGETVPRLSILCWGQRLPPDYFDASFTSSLQATSQTGKKTI
ncbi:arylsulfotransferase family protein [Afifella sp. JA880]|uniref:arylsulfotransferase family protein n=1 Tax=Afifella sp. JA880 TaxID=2975280 RepID=UPI0021BA85C7|nr:arylsulfotransferase family protein [Afifella sp. JA880]MCT8267790.1 arylsulfotransferase family protein [Afifella sp. JA880]